MLPGHISVLTSILQRLSLLQFSQVHSRNFFFFFFLRGVVETGFLCWLSKNSLCRVGWL